MMSDLQKASIWKRISAFLFDVILLSIAVTLFAWLLSMALGFDGYVQTLENAYTRYGEEYQVDFHMSLNDYEQMSKDDLQRLDEAYAALSRDAEAAYAYQMSIQLTLLITSISILLGYLVMEFTIPMVLKNGQTLGKKIFGICLMRTDGVRIGTMGLFIRTFLGKYTIETMIPVLLVMMIAYGTLGLVGTLVLLGMLVLEIVVMAATATNSLLHDLLAQTVCVDAQSQMIFDTREAMIDYKQRRHAEKVAQMPY